MTANGLYTVCVLIDGTVTVGQSAYCRRSTDETARVFRADSDDGKAIFIRNSRFLNSGVAGDIVPLAILDGKNTVSCLRFTGDIVPLAIELF